MLNGAIFKISCLLIGIDSLVARFKHIICGEVGNPEFEPRPRHIISLVAIN
ncbi:hypothetical protein MTR_7g093800 [Medicago truncatula]|uniref:Uncharacterized protein n=1 Tax=Medicago truncatula TaxID=3880 RepID=G7KWC1_MEDTR|nr:hypothetical protein MTR_7g093800 [Medicago truncatula]